MALKISSQAPYFTLLSTTGKDFTLSKDMAGKPCILYFYPRDFSMGCTAEACEFRNEFEEFAEVDVPVIGISKDTIETHHKFKKQYKLPFDLLADTDKIVTELYQAIIPIIGYTKRTTYLLNASHQIVAVYDNLIYPHGHISAMLKAIKNQLISPK
jgi:thioredoxin-dependent peroxiredoxin